MSEFPCGHPTDPNNQYKIGGGRVRCRRCHLTWRKQFEAKRPRDRMKTKVSRAKDPDIEIIESQPGRLALRKFSWET